MIGLGNGSAEVPTTYTYSPFGTASETGETSGNPFQFTGRENDGTGLQYNCARYYDPAIGRFISRDPAGFAGSGPNLYAYAAGDPLDYIDPYGLSILDAIGGWVSEAAGVASEVGGSILNGIEEGAGLLGEYIERHYGQITEGAALVACLAPGIGSTYCLVATLGGFGASTYQNLKNPAGFSWSAELIDLAGALPGLQVTGAEIARMGAGALPAKVVAGLLGGGAIVTGCPISEKAIAPCL